MYVEVLRKRKIKSKNGRSQDVMVKRKKEMFGSFQLTAFYIKEKRSQMYFIIFLYVGLRT